MNREPWYRWPGFCGLRPSLAVLTVVAVIIFTIIWSLTPPEPQKNHTHATRAVLDEEAWKQAQAYLKENPTNNLWLAYTNYTSRTITEDSCLACAAARPTLMAVPMPFNSSNCYIEIDETNRGTNCGNRPVNQIRCHTECKMRVVHALGQGVRFPNRNSSDCLAAENIRIMKDPQEAPTMFTMCKTCQFECFHNDRKGGIAVGEFPNCHVTWNVTKHVPAVPIGNFTYLGGGKYDVNGILRMSPREEHFTHQDKRLSDIWWMCGERPMQTLPYNWTGTCTQVMFVTDGIHILAPTKTPTRNKRHAPGGSFDSRVYIDGIGLPTGVPDEFKARDQIAGGRTHAIPLIGTIIESAKNTEWINYIYYNQQRFINMTHDGMKGLAEQLAPTSLMAWQTRMGVDMLLAEKGGLCVMFGDTCCTFVLNNTAPDGTVTRALDGLRALRDELAENSGVNSPIWAWMDSVFGKWKSFIMSIVVSLIAAVGMLGLCGCCIIPCARGLIMRATETALTHQMLQYVPAPVTDDCVSGSFSWDKELCELLSDTSDDSDEEKADYV